MGVLTKFLKLLKPEEHDYYNAITEQAENWQKIDEWAEKVDEDVVKKEKIANNLTTEEEGYVLDGRQGKILNDKKFDKAGGMINGAVQIDETLFVRGATNLDSSLRVGKGATFNSTADFNGVATFKSDAVIQDSLVVNGSTSTNTLILGGYTVVIE